MARIRILVALLLSVTAAACATEPSGPQATPQVFALCANCHTTGPGGKDLVGPNLAGLFQRRAGSKPGYDYSDGLAQATFAWDDAKLDRWLENPQAFIPGARMYVRVESAGERAAVIAYLHRATVAL